MMGNPPCGIPSPPLPFPKPQNTLPRGKVFLSMEDYFNLNVMVTGLWSE